MTKGANDNNPLTFITLAALTANVTRYLGLNEKKTEKREREPDAGDADKEESAERRDYIEQRIRELRAFERRSAGD